MLKYFHVRFVAQMESRTTTTAICTRLPATPGSTSHLGTAGSVGRNFFSPAFPDFRIIKTLMSNESIVSVASDPEIFQFSSWGISTFLSLFSGGYITY